MGEKPGKSKFALYSVFTISALARLRTHQQTFLKVIAYAE